MTIVDKIMGLYPDLTMADFWQPFGTIVIQNDSDGRGDYIAFWRHPEYPEPTQEQLDAIQ